MYLSVQTKSTQKGLMLIDDELFQITQYIEHYYFTTLLKA